ncbi:hypothetical protein ACROYT_G014941 [Oculina patagonica]
MKDCLAAILRHSRQQAQSTYDHRIANQKKKLAFGLAQCTAEQGGPSSAQQEESQVPLFKEDSSLQDPKILLGRIHAFLPEDQALLLWNKCMGTGVSFLQADGTHTLSSTYGSKGKVAGSEAAPKDSGAVVQDSGMGVKDTDTAEQDFKSQRLTSGTREKIALVSRG